MHPEAREDNKGRCRQACGTERIEHIVEIVCAVDVDVAGPQALELADVPLSIELVDSQVRVIAAGAHC